MNMQDKIRVLIVDDNDDTRDGTRRLLEYEDNIEIVGFAENGQAAVEQARELRPTVILMDINMPVMDGLAATEIIKREMPATQIIVVSVQDDAHYMRQAFQKGASDFVAKPITSAELANAIEKAARDHEIAQATARQYVAQTALPGVPGGAAPRSSLNGSVIAVMGLKGGVGKTTVAISLGVGLARLMPDRKTVIVDSNLLFGDVAVFLNTRGQQNILSVIQMASEPEGLEPDWGERVLIPHESGAKLLLAPANPSEAAHVSAELMTNMLNTLKQEFHYVVVDTSTMVDEVWVGTLRAADRLVILTTPTMPSLKDARLLFNELASAEFPREHVVLVLNESDKNSRITPDQIANFLKHPVAAQIPDDPIAVEALNQGIPLVMVDPRRGVSVRPLANLVQLVRDSLAAAPIEEEEVPVPQRRSGLFGGILGG